MTGTREVLDTQIRIQVIPPQSGGETSATASPRTIVLKPEEFKKTAEEIVNGLDLEQEEKTALISTLLSHVESTFKLETKDSFSNLDEYYTYLAYAHLFKALGYEVKTDGNDKELSESLHSAAKAYAARKKAEGIQLEDAGESLTGTLLLLLARDYQLTSYGDAETITSAQTQVVTEELTFNQEIEELVTRALAEFELEKGLLEKIRAQAKAGGTGYQIPQEFNNVDEYYLLLFYARLLQALDYSIKIDAEDKEVLASVREAVAKFKKDQNLEDPASPTLSPKAILRLIKLYGDKLYELAQELIDEHAAGIDNASLQFTSVLQGREKVILLYDKRAKKLKVLVIKGTQATEVPLEKQAVAKVLAGITGSDLKLLIHYVTSLAIESRGKEFTFKQVQGAAQILGAIAAGKLSWKAIANGQKLRGSRHKRGHRLWPLIKKLASPMFGKKDLEDSSLLDKINLQGDLSNLLLLALGKGKTRKERIDALRAAMFLSKARVGALLPKMREIRNELKAMLENVPSELKGIKLAAVVDGQVLKTLLEKRYALKSLEKQVQDDPQGLLLRIKQDPESVKKLNINHKVLEWQAKIRLLKEENHLTPEKIGKVIKEIYEDKELKPEQRKLVIQSFIQARVQMFKKDDQEAVEDLIELVAGNEELTLEDQKQALLVLYESLLNIIETKRAKEHRQSLSDDMEPVEKRRQAAVKGLEAALHYLEENQDNEEKPWLDAEYMLGKEDYLVLTIPKKLMLIKEGDGAEAAEKHIAKLAKDGVIKSEENEKEYKRIKEEKKGLKGEKAAEKYLADLKEEGKIKTTKFGVSDLKKMLAPQDTLVRLIKMVKTAKSRLLPEEGVPEYDFAISNFKRFKVFINEPKGKADEARRRLIELFKEAAKVDPELGIQVKGQKVTVPGLGVVDIVVEEIPDGSDWEKENMYKVLNERERKAQQMLIDLGHLTPQSDMAGLSSLNYDGFEFYMVAVTRYVEGKYCYPTLQAMGQFNATAFNKTGKQVIDAKFTEKNLAALEKKHAELMSTRMVVGVQLISDLVTGEIDPKVLGHTFNGVSGKELLESFDRKPLLDIALKLHIARKAGMAYLLMKPKEAVKKENLGELAKAIFMFYMQNAEAITGRKPDTDQALRNSAKEMVFAVEKLRESVGSGRNIFERKAAERLIPNKKQRAEIEEQLNFVCINDRFLKVLNEAYSKSYDGEPAGVADAETTGRIYESSEAAALVKAHPFAGLVLRARQALNIPEGGHDGEVDSVPARLTIAKLRLIREYVNPFKKPGAADPYIHIIFSQPERKLLKERIDNIQNQAVKEILQKLTEQSELDPSKPWNLTYRIELKSDQKEALDEFYKEIKESDPELAKLILLVRMSYYSDASGRPEDADTIDALIEWMKENNVKYLDPQTDYYAVRNTNDNRYLYGRAVIERLARSSKIGAMFGAGVKVHEGEDFFLYELGSRIFESARLLINGQIDPTKGSLGIGGVEAWRLIALKKMYYRETGLDKEWKSLFDELKENIDKRRKIRSAEGKYKNWTMTKRRVRAFELLRKKEVIESRLNFLITNLNRVDYDFYQWFCHKFAQIGAGEKALNFVLDTFNQRFFEAKGFRSAFTGKQIALGDLKEFVLKAENDPTLQSTGWNSLSPLGEDEKFGDAKQAMALLITYLPLEEGSVENTNPVIQNLGMTLWAMFTTFTPPYHIGADAQNLTIMLTQKAQERNELLLHSFELTPDQIDKQFAAAFARVFKEVCISSGKQGDYAPTIKALENMAETMKDDDIIVADSDDLENPNVKLLVFAVFLINRMLQKTREKEGLTVTQGVADRSTVIGRITGSAWNTVGLPFMTEEFWQENARKDTDKFQGPEGVWEWINYYVLTHFKEAAASFATFGPFMGLYFGAALPGNLGVMIGRCIGGDEVIDLDPSGMPRVDKYGYIKTRKIGLLDIAEPGLNLITTILLFRNFAPVFYNMLGVWDDFLNGYYWQAMAKAQMANFFLLFPGKRGFVDSGIGRTVTFDRYAWKMLYGIRDFLERRAKGTVVDQKLEPFAKFFENHPRLKQAIMQVSGDLPNKGVIGAVLSEMGKTNAFRWLIKLGGWKEEKFDLLAERNRAFAAMKKLGVHKLFSTGTLRFALDPLGTLLRASAEAANESRVANGFQNVLNKISEYSFQKTRFTYWEGRAAVGIGERRRRRSAYKATDPSESENVRRAQQEAILRQRGQSQDVLGNLFAQLSNNMELIVEVKDGKLVPVVGDYNDNNRRIVERVLDYIPALEIKGINKSLKVTRVYIDSPEALTAMHPVSYSIVRPSMATPLEICEVELHVRSDALHGIWDIDRETIYNESKELVDRAKFIGIDNPQMARDRGLLEFKEVKKTLKKADITVEADSGMAKVLDLTLKQEGLDKLIDFCRDAVITKIDANTWIDIKAFLARNLIERPNIIEAEKGARMIYEAAGEMVEGKDYTINRIEDGTLRRKVRLTDAGRKKLIEIVKRNLGEADYVVTRSLEQKVNVYLETERFATDVIEGSETEMKRLKNLKKRQFKAEVKRFYSEIKGEMTYRQLARAARYAREAVRRIKGWKEPLNFRQVQAGYLASLNIEGTEKVRTAIDFGTGEGKTVTLALPQYIAALRGDKLIITTSTTDTYAKDGYRSVKDILKLLGIRTEYVASQGEGELLKAAKMRADGRVVVYTAFDQGRFQELFDALNEVTGRNILPVDRSNVIIFLDESDFTIGDKRPDPAVVSGGAGKKAEDAKLVEQADAIIKAMKWVNDQGVLTKEGKKYITNPEDERRIGINEDGFKKISEEHFDGKKVTNELHERLRTALLVHKFYLRNTHYINWFRNYIFRDPFNGRLYPGMQFDAKIHKAIQAKEGKTVTDPGLSSISIMPHVFLRHFGRVVLLSGSNYPMAKYFGQDGYFSLPVQSYFDRTRVDHPGVMAPSKKAQMKMVVDWAIRRILEGHPVLIHTAKPGEIDPKTGKPKELNVLNIEELRAALEAELEAIRTGKKGKALQQRLAKVENNIAEMNSRDNERRNRWQKQNRVLIQSLTDVRNYSTESRIVGRMADYGVLTLSDTANRAVDPKKGRTEARLKELMRFEEGASSLVSIVTEWKTSVRHYIQEVNRICRPDPAKGRRPEGDMIAIYQIDDPNLRNEAVREFLRRGLIGEREGILVLDGFIPEGVAPARKAAYLQAFADFMSEKGIFTEAERDAYIADGTIPEEHQQAVDLIDNYRLQSDDDLNRSLWERSQSNQAEDMITDLVRTIHQIAEDRKSSFAKILEPQMKKAVERAMSARGIHDNRKWGEEELKAFRTEMKARYGLNIKIQGEFTTAFQLREAINAAIEAEFKAFKDSPEHDSQKSVIAEKMLAKIVKLRTWLVRIQNELNNPSEYHISEHGSRRDIFYAQLPQVMEAMINEYIASGPERVWPKLEQQLVNGKVVAMLRWHTPRKLGKGAYYLVNSVKVTAPEVDPSDVKYFEGLLKSRLAGIHARPASAFVLIEIEGVEYKFDAQGIKALNAKLAEMGSKKRLHVDGFKEGELFILYGDTEPVTEEKTYRILTFTSEDVSSSKKSLGFIGIDSGDAHGEKPKHEIIIRRERIAEVYDAMVEVRFGGGGVDAKPAEHAYARLLFELFPEVTDRKKAAEEGVKAEITRMLEDGTVSHEKGHEGAFRTPLPESRSQYKYLSNGFVDSLYELIAEFHPDGRLAEIFELVQNGSPESVKRAKIMLYEYLFTACQTDNSVKRRVYDALYRLVVDAETGVDYAKLEQFRKLVYEGLKETFQATVDELGYKEDAAKKENPAMSSQEILTRQEPLVEQRYTEFSEALDGMDLKRHIPVRPAEQQPSQAAEGAESQRAARSVEQAAPEAKAEGKPAAQPKPATADPKPEPKITFNPDQWETLKKEGVLIKGNILYFYDKEGKLNRGQKKLFAVRLPNGLTCQKQNGDYVFSRNGETLPIPKESMSAFLREGLRGTSVLGVKLEIHSATISRSLRVDISPNRLNFILVPPIRIDRSAEIGEVLPPQPPKKAEAPKVFKASDYKTEEALLEALENIPDNAEVVYEGTEKIHLRAHAKELKTWRLGQDVFERIVKDAAVLPAEAEGDLTQEQSEKLGEIVDVLESKKVLRLARQKKAGATLKIELGSGRTAVVEALGNGVVRIKIGEDIEFKVSRSDLLKLIKRNKAIGRITARAKKLNPEIKPEAVEIYAYQQLTELYARLEKRWANFKLPIRRLKGTKAEIKMVLTHVPVPFENSHGESTHLMIDKKDAETVIKKLQTEMIPEAPESLEAQGRKLAGRGDQEQAYQEALSRIKEAFRKADPKIDAEKAVEDFISKLKTDLIAQRAQVIFRNLGMQEAEKALKEAISKIDTELPPEKFEEALKKAVSEAHKVMLRINQRGYELLLKKVGEMDNKGIELDELSGKEIEKILKEAVKKSRMDIRGLSEEKLNEDIKATAQNLKAMFNPKGRGFGAWMEWFGHGAPTASGRMKLATMGVNTGRGALMGAILEAPFSILKQKLLKGEWKWDQLLSDMAHGAWGWATFEFMTTTAKAFMGMGEFGAMGLAIGLPTLWSLRSARSSERGTIFSVGALNLAGFMLPAKGVGKLLHGKNLPNRFKWIGKRLPLVAGVAGASIVSTLLELGMEHSPTLRKILDHPAFHFLGDVGAAISAPSNVYITGRLLTGLGNKFGWARMASLGTKLARLNPALALTIVMEMEGCHPAREKYPAEARGSLGDLASGALLNYVEAGREGSRDSSPVDLYLNEGIFNNPTILKSPLIWQAALSLYKSPMRDEFIRKIKYFADPSLRGKYHALIAKLESSLQGVDFSNQKAIEKAYVKFYKALEARDHFAQRFGDALMLTLRDYVKELRTQRGLLDEDLSPEVRENLKKEYAAFLAHQEWLKHTELRGRMKKIATELLRISKERNREALAKIEEKYQKALAELEDGDEIGKLMYGQAYENAIYNFKKENSSPLASDPDELKAYLEYVQKVEPNGPNPEFYLTGDAFVNYFTKYLMVVKDPEKIREYLLQNPDDPEIEGIYQSFVKICTPLLPDPQSDDYKEFAGEFAKAISQNRSVKIEERMGEIRKQTLATSDELEQKYNHSFLLADLAASEAKDFAKYLRGKYLITQSLKPPVSFGGDVHFLPGMNEQFIGNGTAWLLLKGLGGTTEEAGEDDGIVKVDIPQAK